MFRPRKDIALFLQVYSQHKGIHLEPEFALIQMGEEKGTLPFRTVEQSWDENAWVWNCVYTLDFRSMPKGSYVLEISWLDQQKEQESKNKIPLKII